MVEYNEIRFADQEVADSAAINCWMEEPNERGVERCGHIIRHNLIADIYGCGAPLLRIQRSRRPLPPLREAALDAGEVEATMGVCVSVIARYLSLGSALDCSRRREDQNSDL